LFIQDLHNEELTFQRFGFTSIIEFVSALPDVVAIERPNPKGDWILYDADSHKPTTQVSNTQQQQQQKGKQDLKTMHV
jgi:hypothetical protein